MKENKSLSMYEFEGAEIGLATRWMWSCLCDLTFIGKIEVILRIIFKKPPKWIYEI